MPLPRSPDFTRPYCYMIDESQPDPSDRNMELPSEKRRYRVCIVFAHEAGPHQMGDEKRGQLPWYWTRETCIEQNKIKLGLEKKAIDEIIGASMRLSLTNRALAAKSKSAKSKPAKTKAARTRSARR